MKGLFRNKAFIITLIAVVLLIALAAISAGERSVTFVESAAGSVIQPIQTFAANASNAIVDFFQRVFKTTDADKENETLQIRLAQLEQVENELKKEQEENKRLKSLLDYTETTPDYTYVTAVAIGKNQGVWFSTFTINAGRNRGIEKDMAVVNSSGLVGRITDVGATWSKVTTVIDSSANVGVMVERTRDNAMLRGALDPTKSAFMELYLLPSGSDLVPGDLIVTNGLGGVYPKGITVGKVSEVVKQVEGQSSVEVNAVIVPTVDFTHIEEVMVIVADASNGAGAEE